MARYTSARENGLFLPHYKKLKAIAPDGGHKYII